MPPRQKIVLTKHPVMVIAFILLASMAWADTHYVAQGGQSPSPDYLDWTTAASNIQDAIGVTGVGDTVLVSNGVYDVGFGGVLDGATNRVYIDKAITVRSANNDPTNTIIKGQWASDGNTNGADAVRCVYMVANSALIGFTLTNGATFAGGAGGGIDCPNTTAIISNCVVTGNSAAWGAGGGIYGTWYNCTLARNSAPLAGGTYGSRMYDCTLIGNSAYQGGGTYAGSLYGCTLTSNSASYEGGGNWGGYLTNCTLITNTAAYGGGGGRGATMYDCRLIGNAVTGYSGEAYGGGAYLGTLYNCTLTKNSSAIQGGGGRGATMFNCTLISNSVTGAGGGVYGGSMSNCTLIGNTATGNGGGAANGTTPMYNCTFTGNSGANEGGGAYLSTLYNCLLVGNSTTNYGGGAAECSLYNCTLANNSAGNKGGGTAWGTLSSNSIIYFNTAVIDGTTSNNYGGTFSYSCTAPLQSGAGNITDNPMFVDTNTANYRLSANSLCINTGTNGSWTTNTLDLDARPRLRYGTVDMGAYEFIRSGTIYGFH